MTYVAATIDKNSSRPGISFSGSIALVIVALASGAAAWTAYPVPWALGFVSSEDINTSSFEDRFPANSASNLLLTDLLRPVAQSLPSELEIKFQQAKEQLAQKLQSQDRRAAPVERVALVEEPTPSSVAAIPVPRPRPVEASLELRDSPVTAQPDNRTLLQKLTDLLPARITLASLAPSLDGGLLGGGPDLASLGYDNLTLYDGSMGEWAKDEALPIETD
jgi:hypothetical protein